MSYSSSLPDRTDRTAPFLGAVCLSPTTPIVAGAFGTWTLTYTVGAYGVDEGGTIKMAQRFASDWQAPQFDRPAEAGYTTVTTDGDAKLAVRYDRKGHARPWMRCIVIDVYDGSLAPGDTVTITLGDTSGGGPGSRAQTFQESSHVFQFFVDPTNACVARAVPDCPAPPVVAGEAAAVVVTAPAQAALGEAARFHLRGEDRWGNPTPTPPGVTLQWRGEGGCACELDAEDGVLSGRTAGWGRIIANWNGNEYASNPITIGPHGPLLRYWGDLHAQSDATVGTGTEEEYFTFARDVARLDFSSHQGNDFQMSDEDWRRLNDAVRRFHENSRFVVFPGYEWSGNSPAGGDRNVFYLEEGMPIIRSSPWQLEVDEATDLEPHVPADALFRELRERVDVEKVLCGSHVGGRYADIRRGFDEELGPLIELVSCWGVFEWMLHDAIDLGRVFGVMANSDGHKGRPGAEGPGAGEFGIAGGLTCVLAPSLTREAIFRALKERRCYGTTGARIALDFAVDDQPMGSVLRAAGDTIRVQASVRGAGPVERLQLFRGHDVVHEVTAPAFARLNGSRRIRVTWGGSRIRGRGRRATWSGTLRCDGTPLLSATTFSFDGPNDGITDVSQETVSFRSSTTGDVDGLDLLIEDPTAGTLALDTPVHSVTVPLASLTDAPQRWAAGGLDLFVEVRRYPETIDTMGLEFAIDLPAPREQREPIFVKAIQVDGQMAWSSPIFVTP